MAADSRSSRQYFLGIGGEQVGPFTEAEIREKIRLGEAPDDSLVWYEGLTEWVTLGSIEFFRDAWSSAIEEPGALSSPPVSGATSAPILTDLAVPSPPSPYAKRSESSGDATIVRNVRTGSSALARSLRESEEGEGPVFGGGEEPPWYTDRRILTYGGAALGGVILLFAIVQVIGSFTASEEAAEKAEIARALATDGQDPRMRRVRDADARISFSSTEAIAELRKVLNENSSDAAAEEALAVLKRFYQRAETPVEYARLLRSIKRFKDAAPLLATHASSKSEAVDAYYEAYQAEKDPQAKRNLLIKHIQLGSRLIDKRPQMVDRVKLLEKEYPGQRHPYGYYLKDGEKQIVDLFTRLSPILVQGLMAYVEAEFPEVHLMKRPTVELKKNKDGLYRIVGTYQGDVQLRTDRVRGISFSFWYIDEKWAMIDTNFTPERRRQARQQRERIETVWSRPAQMARYLEGFFSSQFPGVGLHEPISPSLRKPSDQDSDL